MVVKKGKVAPKKVALKKSAVAPKKAKPKAKAAPKTKIAVKKAAPPKKKKAVLEMPEILRDEALKVLDARKADNIMLIDLKGRSPIADYVIIASGGSARQLGALAEYLREAFFKVGQKRVRVEGLPQGDWVLVDAGDVLIHLFRPEVRGYYKLEEIWEDS